MVVMGPGFRQDDIDYHQPDLPAGQAGIHRGPEAAMPRGGHRRAGAGFEEQDREAEDDQCRGEQRTRFLMMGAI